MTRKSKVVANINYGGRYADQLKLAKQTGQCIFCGSQIQKQDVLKVRGRWLLRHNQFPTKDRRKRNPKYHLLIIPRLHFLNFDELRTEDFKDIARLVKWAKKKFHFKGGGLFLRMDDPGLSGATVLHFHWHLVVPRKVKGKAVPVDMPVG